MLEDFLLNRLRRTAQRHRSAHPLATSDADECFIMNSALRNLMMNATQLQAHLREHGLCARGPARVPDHTTRIRHHRLAWAREHLRWKRNQWASVLFSD
uniref:Transposase Tc1-like domain-containing protein n=1 Tax=Cyprinus carpio TaxID=7962 RepID=A0A8C1WHH5_CYPCA